MHTFLSRPQKLVGRNRSSPPISYLMTPSHSHSWPITPGHHLSQRACRWLPEVRRSYDMGALNTCPDRSFSDIYERWGSTRPNNPLCIELCGAGPHVHRYTQRTVVEKTWMICSGVITQDHLTGPSQMTGLTGRKAAIATSLLPFSIYQKGNQGEVRLSQSPEILA